MTTTTATLVGYFETRTRDDGTTYVTLRDDRPEWLYDAVYAAHDDEGPNDWRYEICASLAEWLDELDDVNDDDADTFEIADRLTEIYTSHLFQWLADRPGRADYCDEAAEEFGAADGLVAQVTQGQFHCIRQMADTFLSAARDAAAEADDDTDEEG